MQYDSDWIICRERKCFFDTEYIFLSLIHISPRAMMGIDSCGMLLSAIHEEEGEEKPVSYTHLDVYKRQVMELRARINAHLRREHREHSVRMVLGRVCIQI